MTGAESGGTDLTLTPYHLRVDAREAPLGIGTRSPEFGWRLRGDGAHQSSYEIDVRTAPSAGSGTVVWEASAHSADQFGVRYAGAPLRSATRYVWRVRATDDRGARSRWSEDTFFETGLLDQDDWSARWIGARDDTLGRPIYLRGEIAIPANVVRARAYASALGWYRLFANGTDLTGDALVPRFTSYDHEVEYQAYDLTPLVSAPALRLDLVIGDGRFRGALGMHNRRETYGARLGGLVQVVFELADGTTVQAGSDGSWRGGHGPIVAADPKFGETIDLRIASPLAADAPAADLAPVAELDSNARQLVPEATERVRAVETLGATVTRRADGAHLVDFGQNFAGVVRLRVSGPAGRSVTLQHSEDVLPDGTLEWAHLDREGAKDKTRAQRFQRDEIILDGRDRWVQPWFTLHGFRYVEITGIAELSAGDVQGIVLSTALPATGSFDSSHPLLNQLWRNARWSMVSNFLDTPTDCPTRERGGFTGDAMIFAPAATVFADVQSYFRRYLSSLSLDQFADGPVPMIIPSERSTFSGGPARSDVQRANAVGWGDAAVLLPWTMYQRYGDRAVLEAQYPSMTSWVDHVARRGARRGFQWGEWNRAGESTLRGIIRDNSTNRKNIAYAYLTHSARILAAVARILARDDDAARYDELARTALRRWRRVARKRGGRIGANRQDDYLRALAFDLLPEAERDRAVARLVQLIESSGDHLGTGFLSTPMLLPVLARFGRTDIAYRLLLQSSAPSWLSMVRNGATTINENWTERGRNGERLGSSNHYAFGSVIEWFASGIAGIAPLEPGYRRVLIAPQPGGGLTRAHASVDSPFGAITVAWRLQDDRLLVSVDIPVGVEANVQLPGGAAEVAAAGHHEFAGPTTGP